MGSVLESQRDSIVDVQSECGKMDVKLLNNHFEDASNKHQMINMGNLASKPDLANFEHQNDSIEINNNPIDLEYSSSTFELDIQQEVVVTTSTKTNEHLASNKANNIESVNGKAIVKHGTNSHMKRRRTLDESGKRSGIICVIFLSMT